jgi:hypothetical protein
MADVVINSQSRCGRYLKLGLRIMIRFEKRFSLTSTLTTHGFRRCLLWMVDYMARCTHLQTCPLIRKQWCNSTHDGQLQLATLCHFLWPTQVHICFLCLCLESESAFLGIENKMVQILAREICLGIRVFFSNFHIGVKYTLVKNDLTNFGSITFDQELNPINSWYCLVDITQCQTSVSYGSLSHLWNCEFTLCSNLT